MSEGHDTERTQAQTFLFLVTWSSFSGVIKMRSLALQRVLGVPGGLLPEGRAPTTSPGRRTEGILPRCPSHLMQQRFSSQLLPDDGASHPTSKG